jgi:hypothetical protein
MESLCVSFSKENALKHFEHVPCTQHNTCHRNSNIDCRTCKFSGGLKCSSQNQELTYKSTKSGKSHGTHGHNEKQDGVFWHFGCDTAVIFHQACVFAVINHTDEKKQCTRGQTVSYHLKNGARLCGLTATRRYPVQQNPCD